MNGGKHTLNYLGNYGVHERFLSESTPYPQYELTRVIAQYRRKYKIVTQHREMLAELSGKLRYDTTELAHYPAVGDYVMVSAENENSDAAIH